MNRALAALCILGLVLAGPADAQKRDMDLERLGAALNQLANDAELAPLASAELIGARAALAALAKARGKDERAHALYLAERSVDIAQTTAQAARDERAVVDLGREHDRILLRAAQRDAELARLEAEKLRLQSLAQEEEAARAREAAEAARLASEEAGRELENALATAEQAKRLAAAQAEEASLARQEAALARSASQTIKEQMRALRPYKDARGSVMTLGDFVFAPGSATLQPEVLANLDRIVEFVKGVPATPVRIEGHTDDRGGAKANQQLSQRRAEALRAALVKRGLPAKRITAQGRGADQPVASNDTAEGRAQNRRVDVILVDAG